MNFIQSETQKKVCPNKFCTPCTRVPCCYQSENEDQRFPAHPYSMCIVERILQCSLIENFSFSEHFAVEFSTFVTNFQLCTRMSHLELLLYGVELLKHHLGPLPVGFSRKASESFWSSALSLCKNFLTRKLHNLREVEESQNGK